MHGINPVPKKRTPLLFSLKPQDLGIVQLE